jgi:cytochrome P450
MEAIEGRSLQTTRSKQEHKERRKAWDQALSTKSLRDYEPRLNRHAYALVSKLQEHAHEESVRISNWVNFYSFDVMGDIGYNHKFGMVEKGKEDRLIELLHTGMVPLSVFNHVPWALSFLLRHGAAGDVLEFSAWTASTLKERKKVAFPPCHKNRPQTLTMIGRLRQKRETSSVGYSIRRTRTFHCRL